MTRSIRGRLVLAVVALTLPILALGVYALYTMAARSVRASFDRDLRASAKVLAELGEHDTDGYEFELDRSTARVLAADSGVFVIVWRPDGSVLFRTEGAPDLAAPSGEPGESAVHGLHHDGRRLRYVSYRFHPRSDVAAEQAALMGIAFGRPTRSVDATTGRLQLWFAAITGLLVVVTGFLIARGVGVGLAPLQRIGDEIAALDTSTVDGRVSAQGVPSELAPLVDRLNSLLARHQEAFDRERRFTADAAHELRTPLAVMQTELDVALRRDRDAADYRGVLDGIRGTVGEMTACVDALLLIARADAGKLEARPEPVGLRALATDCWALHESVADQRGITCDIDIDAGARATCDRAVLRIIVSNLLSNAAHHANADSRVRVFVPDGAVIAVSNRATELDHADVSRLFDRFWRRDTARTDTALHSGLGLSVVESLAARTGLSVGAALSDEVLTITLNPEQGEPS